MKTTQAAYIEEIINHEGFSENIYRYDKGHLIHIVRGTKDMYEKASNSI